MPWPFHASAYCATSRSVRLGPVPPDPDWRVRLLHGRRGERGVLQTVVVAAEAHALLPRPQQPDDLQRLLEAVEAVAKRAEVEAVGGMLTLEPARADAEVQPAPGNHVHRGSDLREVRGVAERVAGDHGPESQSRDARGESCEGGPALEAGSIGVSHAGREEVIVGPGRVVAQALEQLPGCRATRPS